MSRYTPTGIPGITARSGRLYLRLKTPTGEWIEEPTSYVVGQEALALRALEQVKRQLVAGAEVVGPKAGPVTVGAYVTEKFFPRRRDDVQDWKSDETRLKSHILLFRTAAGRIADMPLADVRTRHLADAFRALRKKRKSDGTLYAPKTIHNTYGVVLALFRDAIRDELIFTSPCALDERDLGPNVDKDPEWRETALFEREELELLISNPLLPEDRRLWYALEGLGAMRLGEAAALRWRHWLVQLEPLGGLLIAKSHDKEHTKTHRVRKMPVHPVLARMLTEWKLSGWVRMMGRHATPDDLVCPVSKPESGKGRRLQLGAMRTEKYVSDRTKKDLAALGLRHRRGHDLRATFITFATADGANETHLEACTHTPKKKSAFDLYNRIPWPVRCAAVAALKVEGKAPARGELVQLRTAVGAQPVEVDGSERAESLPSRYPEGETSAMIGKTEWRRRESNPSQSIAVDVSRVGSSGVDAGGSKGISAKAGKSACADVGRSGFPGNGVTAAAAALVERGEVVDSSRVLVPRDVFEALASALKKGGEV